MPIKVGTSQYKIPFSKAYIGDDLYYQSGGGGGTITPFSANPAPTTWTITTNYYKAEGTNSYGTWKIEGDNTATIQNTSIAKGFDGDVNTYYMAKANPTSALTPTVTTFKLPDGVSIKPTSLTVRHFRSSSTAKTSFVYGKTEDTDTWMELGTLTNSSGAYITDTFTLSGDDYFTEFKVSAYSRNSSMNFEIQEFEITSGYIKT